ncbi:MAG: type II toxin-antitoxin system RelB/DinJ family antitoxin [Anaerolineales bacterium]|nr:type II toxin-antitoxin system RelB/DinJ family antitoxin [Anaerolineales bacterium]
MVAKTDMIRARVDPALKLETEDIFRQLGLSVTEAITLFYQQVRLTRGIPFPIRLPNETTLQTFQDTDAGQNVVRCKDTTELMDRLGF